MMKSITKMKTRFKILLGLMIMMSFLSENAFTQTVSPFQTGDYMTCFINVRDMGKMAPGFDVISYNYYAWTKQFADKDGVKYSHIDLDSLSLGIDMNTFATVPAFYWGSTFTLFGGATYVVGIVPNYYWANVNVTAKQGLSSLSSNTKLSGFGDLFVQPLGLSWGWKHFDATLNYAFTAPTGRYESGADDNIGMGFWANQFQGFAYWYPDESQASAFMLGLTYEINSKTKGEELKIGNRLSLEYGISQYLSDRLELSVMGGNNWQVSDDSGEDVIWDPKYHDKKSTLAFGAAYWAVQGRLYIAAKYMFDYGAQQRFLSNGFMLNLIFVTNALDGVKKDK